MSEEVTRYWYSVRSKVSPILSYIVSAVSLEKARENFWNLKDLYDFKKLTADELYKLTGCCPPSDFQRDLAAVNGVMFQNGSDFFMIRIAD